MTNDVVIVGGGIMGSAAAWALARSGRDVLLLECFEPGHDKGGSHGQSRLFRLLYGAADYLEWGTRSLRMWREVEAASGQTLLETTGSIDTERRDAESAAAFLRRNGVAAAVIAPEEGRERWPGLRFESPILHQPDGARLRASDSITAFQQVASAEGADIRHQQRVRALEPGGNGVAVVTDSTTFRARHVVVAAGPWTPALVADLAILPQLKVTQEQLLHFPGPAAAADWPNFLQRRTGPGPLGAAEAFGLYEPGWGVKVGLHATGRVIDLDARDRRPDPDVDDQLRAHVRDWLPSLGEATAEPLLCLYDNTANGDFVVDRVHSRVTVATGFSGHGFKFAPVLGEMLAASAVAAESLPDRFSVAAHR